MYQGKNPPGCGQGPGFFLSFAPALLLCLVPLLLCEGLPHPESNRGIHPPCATAQLHWLQHVASCSCWLLLGQVDTYVQAVCCHLLLGLLLLLLLLCSGACCCCCWLASRHIVGTGSDAQQAPHVTLVGVDSKGHVGVVSLEVPALHAAAPSPFVFRLWLIGLWGPQQEATEGPWPAELPVRVPGWVMQDNSTKFGQRAEV
jgi:hypothetical protein